MSVGVCGDCGRAVKLRGRARICSNCDAIRNSAACGECGEHRRVAARTPDGRPWCERCRKQTRRRDTETDRRRLIIEVVTAVCAGSLSEHEIRTVLTATVTSPQSLRRLAGHLACHRDTFEAGPTSELPILHRFTLALVAAGAANITTIHPLCSGCRRRQPRHARTEAGVLCAACWNRTHKQDCSVCRRRRPVSTRDEHGHPLCEPCLHQARRRERLEQLNQQIIQTLPEPAGSLAGHQVIDAIRQAAPTGPLRAELAQHLHDAPPLTIAAPRPAAAARLLAQLRAHGADLPAALCAECGQPADPQFLYGGMAICRDCERRRDRDRRRDSDTDTTQPIIDAVTAADPALTQDEIRRVLADAAPTARHLTRLAQHLRAHPDMFTAGPTTTAAVADRFTRALIAAGATTIQVIDPACDRCGRRRRRYARTPTGGLCTPCSRTWLCPRCGHDGRLATHPDTGDVTCRRCDYRQDTGQLLTELADQITTSLTNADPSIGAASIAAALDATVPDQHRRRVLAGQLHAGPPLADPARRHPTLARFLAELRHHHTDLPAAACTDCDGPAEPLAIHHGVVRCHACATRCPGCRHPRARPPLNRCRWCGARAPQPACTECGRAATVGIDDDGRCRSCRQRAGHHCDQCGQTSHLTHHGGTWRCQSCALSADLDDRLGPVARMPVELLPVRAAIITADNPAIVRRWLATSSGGQLLARLTTGDVPLTHEGLDHAGTNHSVDYLRALLVAAGALPDTDRALDQLAQSFDEHVAAITDPADRKAVQAWLRWQVLARLRKRASAGEPLTHSPSNARRALRCATRLLDHLARAGRTLRTAQQADIDNWFAQPGTAHWQARTFLAWARRRNHLDRRIQLPPASTLRNRTNVIDGPGRWDIAKRLVEDNTIPADDRVTAALVVLYGQPLSRIARLTTNDIRLSPSGAVDLDLDGHYMPLHEPFADLIQQLPRRRTNGVADQIENTWLFPGSTAGNHIWPSALGNRLAALGIQPRTMRNTARAELVTQIPPAVLGELIGISPATASHWATLTNSNWNTYAGRPPRQPHR